MNGGVNVAIPCDGIVEFATMDIFRSNFIELDVLPLKSAMASTASPAKPPYAPVAVQSALIPTRSSTEQFSRQLMFCDMLSLKEIARGLFLESECQDEYQS